MHKLIFAFTLGGSCLCAATATLAAGRGGGRGGEFRQSGAGGQFHPQGGGQFHPGGGNFQPGGGNFHPGGGQNHPGGGPNHPALPGGGGGRPPIGSGGGPGNPGGPGHPGGGAGNERGWYHGAWHGNYSGGWGYHPNGWGYPRYGMGFGYGGYGRYGGYGGYAAYGLGGFGLGLATGALLTAGSPYSYGYWGYTNPYYAGGSGLAWGNYNYSQPLVMAASAAVADPNASGNPNGGPDPTVLTTNPPDGVPANATFAGSQASNLVGLDDARDAFRLGNYPQALALADKAIAAAPSDAVLHEFRALCEFALGNYQPAAAGIYTVLNVGPGWDWTTVSSLYPRVDVYTIQLRSLENYVRQNPAAADARFLLAYQYLVQGYDGAAETQFAEVLRLQPTNEVAAQMYKTLTNPSASEPPPSEQAVASQAAPNPGPPIDARKLVGDWQATGPDGAKFKLDLAADNTFTWQFTRQDNTQSINGQYKLDKENVLLLQGSDQNNMAGQIELSADNRMKFKLPGNNPGDSGLMFSR